VAWGAGVGVAGAGNGNTAATQFVVYAVKYTLDDEFTTTEGAPIASPRTCEPGPGTLTKTDASNVLSIASGKLTWAGGANGTIATGTQTRSAGLALVFYPTYSGGGTRSPLFGSQFSINLASLTDWSTAATYYDASVSGANNFLIMRASGTFYVVGSTLAAINGTGAGNTVASILSGATLTADYFRLAQLPAPWNSSFGIATGYTASPSSGATLTHTADGYAVCKWVATTGATMELRVRQTDPDNCQIIRCDQGGSTIKIIERVAGVETEKASAAQTWTNGTIYRINAMFNGNTVRNYVDDAQKNNYTSATFNNTATISVVTATAGTLTDYATFPRTLTGAALAFLQALAP
jgi:hypothetical protein